MYSFIEKTKVYLTWTSSPTDIVNLYTTSYKRIGGCPSASSGSQTTAMKTITISGLEEDIEYKFTITATNTAGTSEDATLTLITPSEGNVNDCNYNIN